MLAANAVPGARATSLAGRLLEGSVQAIHHGVTALDRVLREREGAGLLAPRDKSKPKVGRAALTR